MATPYLDIQNLTKSIGDLVLFENISFSVSEGQHVGLIARNGAGKSTLLGLIAGKDSADSGDIVFQKGLRVGMLEQQPDFDPEMSVLQAVAGRLRAEYASLLIAEEGGELQSHTATFDADEEWNDIQLRAKQILTQLKIDKLDKPVGLLSGGQRKRVALASVLIDNPDLLILDEPTNGLDPAGIEEIRDLLQRLAERGTTVMVSSHLLGEIDKTATVLGVLAQGRLVFQGNRSEMLDVTAPDILIDCAAPSRACESLSSLSPILEQRSDRALIRLRGITRETTAQAISSLVGRGIDIYSAVPEEQTLESAFMRMTQGGGIR